MAEHWEFHEHINNGVARLREYDRLTGMGQIARRYLAMNAFDGVLTIIGVLMGNYIGGIRTPGVVIRTGLATCIAMGISGLWGAYLTEAAERQRELAELERATLTNLANTKIGRASRSAVVIAALVDGLAPFAAALLALIPFFTAPLLGHILASYILSLVIGLASLFGLGMFLGRISGHNLLVYGLRTVVAGVICIGLSFLLGTGEP